MSANKPEVLRYFSYFMILVYAALGGYIIFSPAAFFFLNGWQRIMTGVVFISYGLYRFTRMKDRYRKDDE